MKLGGMFSFLNDVGNFEQRNVRRTKIGNCTISTVWTSDEGYETAIGDAEDHFHPVERYGSREEAIKGHTKWCKLLPKKRIVNKLGGLAGFVPDKLVIIKK